MLSSALPILCLAVSAFALPQFEERQLLGAAPTVTGKLPSATYIGSSSNNVDTFNGIPFAVPPINKNRLKVPQSLTSALGTVVATGSPKACPQQSFTMPPEGGLPKEVADLLNMSPLLQEIRGDMQAEDCLTLNVQRPTGTKAGAKLPVVFWIYGGGFEFGSTNTYNGAPVVSRSAASGLPVIYVAVNYRVSGWGFLPGKEVKAAGVSNLGLLDQRLGLQWVADNIAKFGGDPAKVTIWGESAGAISVFDQMALYDGNSSYKGKPLFRGAIMNSGSVVPANPIDGVKGQAVYDQVVKYAGCSAASDTLECLRNLPFAEFQAAVNSNPAIFTYQSVALSYLPRPDGRVLTDSPDMLVSSGKFAKVPFIIGDQEDEGPLFSLTQPNVTTSDELVTYLASEFFPDAPRSRVQGLVDAYPDKPAAGSPFRTGALNELRPQYKRLAAILGDITFTLTRRAFLQTTSQVAPSLPTWSYLSSYLHGTPFLGTFHGSDLLVLYGNLPGVPADSIYSYYISFFNNLNPNTAKAATLPRWPMWAKGSHQLLQFQSLTNNLLEDSFRNGSYQYLLSSIHTLRV